MIHPFGTNYLTSRLDCTATGPFYLYFAVKMMSQQYRALGRTAFPLIWTLRKESRLSAILRNDIVREK